MIDMDYVSIAIAALAVGIYVGKYLTNEKWSGNAHQIQRVEYNGDLYKVEHKGYLEHYLSRPAPWRKK